MTQLYTTAHEVTETRPVPFDVVDAKGRVLGCHVTVGVTTFVPTASTCIGWTEEHLASQGKGHSCRPGVAYPSVRIQATRDGRAYGAAQGFAILPEGTDVESYVAAEVAKRRRTAARAVR